MAYWLFKTEPDSYSFDDLCAERNRATGWDGVRNYEARNLLRDVVAVGDGVLFYHSSCAEPAVVGVAKVIKAGHPDPSAFDAEHHYFDPKSNPANPTWYQVTIQAQKRLDPPITLERMRATPELASMGLLRKGNRLSIQPVSPEEWAIILGMAGQRALGRGK